MKKIILAAFAALLCLSSCTTSSELKVMSYNIRMDNSGDGENAWPNRKEATIEMIKDIQLELAVRQEKCLMLGVNVNKARRYSLEYLDRYRRIIDKGS